MSIMVGTGRGATAGVLVRHAEVLERLLKVDTLVVDKTGTLTTGKPQVVAIEPAPEYSEGKLLELASQRGAKQRASAGGGDIGCGAPSEASRFPRRSGFRRCPVPERGRW